MTVLLEHLDRDVTLRRALGYRPDNDGRLLAGFVRYLDASDHASVTVEAALAWASGAPTAQAGAARLTVVRGFARYLAGPVVRRPRARRPAGDDPAYSCVSR